MCRAAPFLLGAYVVAVVLAIDPAGWTPFGPAKWWATSVLGFLGTGVTLLAFRDTAVPRRLVGAWAAFLAVAALATVFGRDGLYAWLGTPERHFGWLTWFLCAQMFLAGALLPGRARRALARSVVVALGGTSAYAVVEALWRPPVETAAITSRLGGTFGSAAYLGAALVLFIPIAFGLAATTDESKAWRSGAIASALAGTAVLVGTGTRGAWIGAVVALGAAAWSQRRHLAGQRRAAVRVAVAVLAALVAGALMVPVTKVATRDGGSGGTARLDEWRIAARAVADRPILGHGPEGYRIAFLDAVDAAYTTAHGTDVQSDRAHNGLLDIAATTGVLGLSAFIVVLLLLVAPLRRAGRDGPPVIVGTALALVAYLVQQQVLFPLAELEPIAWLLAGTVVAAGTAVRTAPTVNSTPAVSTAPAVGPAPAVRTAPQRIDRRLAVGLSVAATMAFVLTAIALPAGMLDIAADRAARTALRASAAGDDRTAVAEAVRAADLRPDVVRYHLVLARILATTGRPTDLRRALAEVADALTVSPHDPFARIEQERTQRILDAVENP